MATKRKTANRTAADRLYWKRGRAYIDTRDYAAEGGGLLALIPEGASRATDDEDVALALAKQKLDSLKQRRLMLAGMAGLKRVATVKEYAAEHLEKKAKAGRVTDRWLARAELHLTRLVEYVGDDRFMHEVDVDDAQAWIEHLREGLSGRGGSDGPSDQTLRHHLNSASNLFRRAVAERVALRNPFSDMLEKPQQAAAEARWLELDEAAALLEAARTYDPPKDVPVTPWLYAIVATFLYTGMRKAECLGLKVEDVSFDRGLITVRPNEHRRIKTRNANRVIPLWPELRQILQAHIYGGATPRVSGLLFPSAVTGAMIDNIRSALDTAAERAGLDGVRTKMFRHTYASVRLQTLDRGYPVSPWTVSRELGHGGRSLVDRVYGHLGELRTRLPEVTYQPDAVAAYLRQDAGALKAEGQPETAKRMRARAKAFEDRIKALAVTATP